jgi:hypothetical protein
VGADTGKAFSDFDHPISPVGCHLFVVPLFLPVFPVTGAPALTHDCNDEDTA